MTAIHNTLTGTTTIRQLPLINGQPHPLPEHYILLQVIDTPIPEYNTALQVATSQYQVDLEALTYTKVWTVRDKTEQELTDEAIQLAEQMEQEVDMANIKKLLKPNVDAMTDEEKQEFADMYPAWRPNEPVYDKDDTTPDVEKPSYRRDDDALLYKCISSHTTQLNWRPKVANSLWIKVGTPGVIPEWSSFQSHEFQHMEIGFQVMDNDTIYYLINPAQGHWQPSGAQGHHGWSTTNPVT